MAGILVLQVKQHCCLLFQGVQFQLLLGLQLILMFLGTRPGHASKLPSHARNLMQICLARDISCKVGNETSSYPLKILCLKVKRIASMLSHIVWNCHLPLWCIQFFMLPCSSLSCLMAHISLRLRHCLRMIIMSSTVERILDHKDRHYRNKLQREYIGKWEGFGPEHNTWEPEAHCTNCQD